MINTSTFSASCWFATDVTDPQDSETAPCAVPIPEEVVTRTENRWVMIMVAMLVIMLAVVVVTSVAGALHPSSNVEVIEPQTLHLGGEFVESNLGTAIEPDGSATVRLIAQQYDFVPHCVRVPADTPVKRATPLLDRGELTPGGIE